MRLGEKIQHLRLRYGLTQQELADRAELSKSFISQLERDLTSPSIETLTDILECLGTNLGEFFSEREEEKIVFDEGDMFVKEDETGSIVWLVPLRKTHSSLSCWFCTRGRAARSMIRTRGRNSDTYSKAWAYSSWGSAALKLKKEAVFILDQVSCTILKTGENPI